jgi:hypothetical protein
MKRIVVMSPVFVLAACAGTGMVANKAEGGTSYTRTVEVSSTSALSLRTTAILEASRQCRTEGKRARVIEVKPTGVKPFSLNPEAEATFRCY